MDELLPVLRSSPFESLKQKSHHQGPSRHYRRLIVPQLAARGDRATLFPGHIHSAFTPLAAELQALWGFAFLNNLLEVPSENEMEMEAAIFNAWTRKRYIEQGKKHSYFIYDYISVRPEPEMLGTSHRNSEADKPRQYIDTLMEDLGLNPYRKKSFFKEWFTPYRPRDYRGLIQEYLATRRHAGLSNEEKCSQQKK